jgi:hypothetical protein
MRLILRLDAKVEVLCDVDVLFSYFRLIVLVSCNLDLIRSKDLAQCAWVVVEE